MTPQHTFEPPKLFLDDAVVVHYIIFLESLLKSLGLRRDPKRPVKRTLNSVV